MALELSRDGGDFVLRDGDEHVARVVVGPSIVLRVGTRTLEAVKYAPGLHLAFVGDDEEPVAWYAGGGGFGGGRIVVAPDREYRLRSRFPLGARWRLTEARRELVRVDATRRWPDARLAVEVRAPPGAADDAALLPALAATVALLQLREPRAS